MHQKGNLIIEYINVRNDILAKMRRIIAKLKIRLLFQFLVSPWTNKWTKEKTNDKKKENRKTKIQNNVNFWKKKEKY